MLNSSRHQHVLKFNKADVRLIANNTRYQGFFRLDEYELTHKLHRGGNSNVIKREVFERGDAVVLIPYDSQRDCVVMLEQFRPGALRANSTPWLLEFVAGMFGENESPEEVAIREAKEEADLDIQLHDLTYVMKYLSSPGGMSEAIHMYVASVDSTCAQGVHGLDSEDEDILVHSIALSDALQLMKEGKITNAASIIGLQWLQLNRHILRK